jgi:hypothetical protein
VDRTGKAQVEELIDAARVPVFLLDQHQVVRPGEVDPCHSQSRDIRTPSVMTRRGAVKSGDGDDRQWLESDCSASGYDFNGQGRDR